MASLGAAAPDRDLRPGTLRPGASSSLQQVRKLCYRAPFYPLIAAFWGCSWILRKGAPG